MIFSLLKRFRCPPLSDDDQMSLYLGKAVRYPDQYLRFTPLGSSARSPMLGYKITERFTISDMHLIVDEVAIGWIETIQIDVTNSLAIVGHFGVAKLFTGTGLGKQLILAFGRFLQREYGVKQIQFEERKINSNPAYRAFFTRTLRAHSVDLNGLNWLWQIP